MTRILFLADINSPHTRKWALSLADSGFTIGIFSLSRPDSDWLRNIKNIEFLSEGKGSDVAQKKEIGKIAYVKALPRLKKAVQFFKPDILHAHYATSYGMLGALSRFHPYIISVWGSDVYDFPKKSFFHKFLLKRNLARADSILSTSHAMALEVAQYTTQKVLITPFGVDINVFKPQKAKSLFKEGDIVIGTIKSLELKYGIEYLIEAFHILSVKYSGLPLKLLIVGGGSKMNVLMKMVQSLYLEDKVRFTGKIPQEEIPDYHNMLDIYVALSINDSESFGVAVVEAEACGKPVVVSNVSGFAEVVENGTTGIIVPVKSSKVAASAIERIMKDKQLAASMGENGRKRVVELYDWSNNLKDIVSIYNSVLNQFKK